MKALALWSALLLFAGLAGTSAQEPPEPEDWQTLPKQGTAEPLTVNDPGEPGGEPSIEVSRLGPIQVERERQVVLAEATVDLAGQAWNYGPDDELAVLYKPLGRGQWSVAATSEPEPGGLFEIAGIQFPDIGDYELITGIFQAGELVTGSSLAEDRWRVGAHAVSRKLFVRVTAMPPPLGRARPSLSILTVGGRSVNPQETTSVPPWGEIVVQTPDLSPGEKVYLAVLTPYSDRCYLHGPARPTPQPRLYVFQGASIEVPGDPRQGHYELVALVSPERLAAGPTSFRSLRRRDALTSPTVEVMLEEKLPETNSYWVPRLAVTRIGRHALKDGEPPDRPLAVEQGDFIEAGLYERVPEGVRLWVLTRPRGSRLWLAQGPAQLRGAPSPDDFRQGPPVATWVWPGARFEHPQEDKKRRRGGTSQEEFEVLAVLSTTSLPASWIDSASLGSSFIQTVSPLVTVKVRPAEPLPKIELSISRVGGKDVDAEGVTGVGATELVEISAGEELPPSFHVYVARHPIASTLWSLTEAIPQGKDLVVPALSFTNPHAEEGARYQLIAFVTPGLLSTEQVEYDDLARFAVASSPVVTVRYETEGSSSLKTRIARWWLAEPPPDAKAIAGGGRTKMMTLAGGVGASETPSKGGTGMHWKWILVVIALLILECWLGMISSLARSTANRIERGLDSSKEWFTQPPRINPGRFFLGILLLFSILYAITRHYLPLYGQAIEIVTDLPRKESMGLALWLVLITALAGIFLELTFDTAAAATAGPVHPEKRLMEHRWLQHSLGWALGLALVGLMVFQSIFYKTFLRKTAGEGIPELGGRAFFLMALVEAITFFFITKLTLEPVGAMLVRFARAPLVLSGLFFRFVERLFGNLPKWASRKWKKTGKSEGKEEQT